MTPPDQKQKRLKEIRAKQRDAHSRRPFAGVAGGMLELVLILMTLVGSLFAAEVWEAIYGEDPPAAEESTSSPPTSAAPTSAPPTSAPATTTSEPDPTLVVDLSGTYRVTIVPTEQSSDPTDECLGGEQEWSVQHQGTTIGLDAGAGSAPGTLARDGTFAVPGLMMTGAFQAGGPTVFSASATFGICSLSFAGECIDGPCLAPPRPA